MPVKKDVNNDESKKKEKKPPRHRDTIIVGGYKYHRNNPLQSAKDATPSTKARDQ